MEYVIPIIVLAVVFIGVPVAACVLVFHIASRATAWLTRRAVRAAIRIGTEERARVARERIMR